MDLPYSDNLFNSNGYYDYLRSIGIKYIVFHNDRGYPKDNNILDSIKSHLSIIYSENDWYLFKQKGETNNIISSYDCIVPTKNEHSPQFSMEQNARFKSNISRELKIFNDSSLFIGSNLQSIQTDCNKRTMVKEYKKISPTQWDAKITSHQPFLLTFAETYDPSWSAEVYVNGRLVKEYKPVQANLVINGFWIHSFINHY